MAAPTVRAVGTVAHATTGLAISPGLPAGTAVGDLLLMVIHSRNTTVTAAGWTSTTGSPAFSGGGAADARVTVLYRVATGTDPTTTSATNALDNDHLIGRIIGITAGTFNPPFNAGSGSGSATSSTSGTAPAITTTSPDCLIVVCAAHNTDTTSSQYSGFTNAALASITEQVDNSTTDNTGGGIGVATGTLATASALAGTTYTLLTASRKAHITLAIAPSAGSIGQTATTEVVGIATAGFPSRLSSTASSFTNTRVTSGVRTAIAAADVGEVFEATTAGTVTVGAVEYFGATSLNLTASIANSNLYVEAIAETDSALTFAASTFGINVLTGATTSAYTVTIVTSGTLVNTRTGTYPSSVTWPGSYLYPGEWATGINDGSATATFVDTITTNAFLSTFGNTSTPLSALISTVGVVNNTPVVGIVAASFDTAIVTAATRATVSSTATAETTLISTAGNRTTEPATVASTFQILISTAGTGPQSYTGATATNLTFSGFTFAGEQGAEGYATNTSLVTALSLLSLLPTSNRVLAGSDCVILATPTSHQEFARGLSYLGLGEPDWERIPPSFSITAHSYADLLNSQAFIRVLALLGYQTHVH